MAQGDAGNLAPQGLILPRFENEDQMVSGAIWISGALIYFMPYDGSDTPQKVTSG